MPGLPGDGSAAVAEATRQARRRERLEASRDRLAADVRSRPEDSSPAIRRLLGNDQPARPPQRWENQTRWGLDGLRLRSVHVGPVDPAASPAEASGRGRPGIVKLDVKDACTVGKGQAGLLGGGAEGVPPQVDHAADREHGADR